MQQLTSQERREKLATLVETEGFDSTEDFLQAVAHDGICPGICARPSCDYTCEVEPDQRQGWCEECRSQSVQSAMILAEVIR